MKKVLVLLAAAALMLSCGGNNQSDEKGKDADGAKSNISIGDKFAFAGLESDNLVPAFAIELSELATDPRSESNPMKDEAFFYTGTDITTIPVAKVDAWVKKVYAAVVKAADGGKVYEAKGISGDELGPEAKEPSAEKQAVTVMYLYQHNGTWFNISAGHKAYFRKFKKDYGDKWIGVGITVKEMLGTVE